MLLLTSIILQATAPPTPMALAGFALGIISLCLTVFFAMRKEAREDGMTPSQRLKKAEARLADHDVLHTGQNHARENWADTFQARFDQYRAEQDRRCRALEAHVSDVQRLKETIAGMQAKLDRLPAMEGKLDRLTELLTAKIANR